MNLFKTLQSIRRTIHQNPELSNREIKTSALVEKILKENKIKTYRICKTGIIGILEGKRKTSSKLKTLALRADLDALPIIEKNNVSYKSKNKGVMHACGHDCNTTIMLGAAMLLAKQTENFSGKIQFMFQPDEEKSTGAKNMIKSGALSKNKVDFILGVHVSPWIKTGCIGLKYGAMMAGVDKFTIEIKGLLGHGAYPHLSKDPIVAGSQFIMSLQTIPSRIINPVEPVVVTVGKIEAGKQYNIIADKITIIGTVRTFNVATRELVKKEITDRLEGIVKSYKMSYTMKYESLNTPLINDDSMVDMCVRSANEFFENKNKIVMLKNPSMGGEDFAEYLKEVKGAFVYVGSASNKATSFPWHHECFDIDEKALVMGAEYICNTAKYILNNKI
ncbi:M20 metallopeptidase family protein [Candidatus Ruminimicrobium bovinum]|uniref:M20 metallopeptidase family protein n=1 Tax=Candidatus Ruminimicrobium bovinum TaxID=3242779 RepID=UPI0039B8E3DD